MHSPASNTDKAPYELSVTSEPSVWGGGAKTSLHISHCSQNDLMTDIPMASEFNVVRYCHLITLARDYFPPKRCLFPGGISSPCLLYKNASYTSLPLYSINRRRKNLYGEFIFLFSLLRTRFIFGSLDDYPSL